MGEKLLTTKEAAKLLGMSRSFLERDRWQGARIPFVRVGTRAVRYRQEEIHRYLNAQTKRSTSE